MEILKDYWRWARTLASGRKAYAVGALMIALGYLNKDYQMMLEGFGIIAIRAGIKKLEP